MLLRVVRFELMMTAWSSNTWVSMLVRFLRVRVVGMTPADVESAVASVGGGLLDDEYLSTTCRLGRASIMLG